MSELIFNKLCCLVNSLSSSHQYYRTVLVGLGWMSLESGHLFYPDDEPRDRIDYDTSVYRYTGNFIGKNNSLIQIGVEITRGESNMICFHVVSGDKMYVISFSCKTKKYDIEETSLSNPKYEKSDGSELLRLVSQDLKKLENIVFKNSQELIMDVPELKFPVEID